MLSNGLNRRSVFLGASLTALATSVGVRAQTPAATDFSQEVQSGDPGAPTQTIAANQKAIGDLFSIAAFNIPKDAKQVALGTLTLAGTYVGKNQADDPSMVEEFFAVFDMNPRDGNGQFLPFCAAGLSYCAARAYCDYPVPKAFGYTNTNRVSVVKEALADVNRFYFRPNPMVGVIEYDAGRRGTWISTAESGDSIKPGYLVIFDWNMDGKPDHVGLVESKQGNVVETLEFNTRPATGNASTGGYVLRRSRDVKFVLGFVRTYKDS
jgi:hypothetical protein